MGCHSGLSVFEARQLCPDGYYVVGNHNKYVYASMRIIEICHLFTPIVEPFSVDEMFLDVTGSIRYFGSKEAVAEGIRQEIKKRLNLPSSVGVAPNKVLAKLASKFAKPDGFFIIDNNNKAEILEELEVDKLFGIGHRTKDKLNKMGIYTAGQLGRFPLEILRRKFGVIGDYLSAIGRGEYDSDVVALNQAQRPKSVSNETTLYNPTRNREYLRKVLLSLVNKVCYRLRKHEAKARTIGIVIRMDTFVTHSYHHTVDKDLFYDAEIYQEVLKLFDKVDFGLNSVRLVGVYTANLVYERDPLQLRIFPLYDEKKLSIVQAVDSLKNKYGTSIINIGDSRTPNYEFRPESSPPLSFGMKNFVQAELETRPLKRKP